MATVIEHPRGQPRNFTWTVGSVRYIVKDIILEPYTEIQNKIIAEEDRVGPDEGCSAWRGRMLESKAQFQAPYSCSGPEVCMSAHPTVRTGNAGIVFRKAEREATVRQSSRSFCVWVLLLRRRHAHRPRSKHRVPHLSTSQSRL